MIPVRQLPYVAHKREQQLARLGIETCRDLLSWFPRDYEDWTEIYPIPELSDGMEQTFLARVVRKPSTWRKGRLSILRTVLKDDHGSIMAIWFNQAYQTARLRVGRSYYFRGKIQRRGRSFQVQNPSYYPCDEKETGLSDPYKPVYGLTEGLTQGVMRRLVDEALKKVELAITDPLPDWMRKAYRLCAIDYAYRRVHHPTDQQSIDISRRRLGFEELFLLRAALWLLRCRRQQSSKAFLFDLKESHEAALSCFISRLPFQLTRAQQRAWSEIKADLTSDRPMNRLLQGDVGSGKTVVAALAMLLCVLNGYQAVLMAPTAILARQHQQTLAQLLKGTGYMPMLLTGSTPESSRRDILEKLAGKQACIVVGTHAVIQDTVVFGALGLAITDEQHRFGVRQRVRLASRSDSKQKSTEPHILVMSATPIPRSLALVLYGDLDLSIIDEKPAGRIPVETYIARHRDRPRVEALIRRFAQEGQQVYVICPAIEDNEATKLESAQKTYQYLQDQMKSAIRVALLHGQMRSVEKDKTMDAFMQGEIQVLVSTTVVEVGVDNPNASLMIIENAERFGLSQLHQLRGRIGRGTHRAVCILMSDTKESLAQKRLKALCRETDGFDVAEQDLQLRGPGDFFGTRQHGLPPLKIVNLYRDQALLAEVQEALDALVRRDPDLSQPEHAVLRKTLLTRYQSVFYSLGL